MLERKPNKEMGERKHLKKEIGERKPQKEMRERRYQKKRWKKEKNSKNDNGKMTSWGIFYRTV